MSIYRHSRALTGQNKRQKNNSPTPLTDENAVQPSLTRSKTTTSSTASSSRNNLPIKEGLDGPTTAQHPRHHHKRRLTLQDPFDSISYTSPRERFRSGSFNTQNSSSNFYNPSHPHEHKQPHDRHKLRHKKYDGSLQPDCWALGRLTFLFLLYLTLKTVAAEWMVTYPSSLLMNRSLF